MKTAEGGGEREDQVETQTHTTALLPRVADEGEADGDGMGEIRSYGRDRGGSHDNEKIFRLLALSGKTIRLSRAMMTTV